MRLPKHRHEVYSMSRAAGYSQTESAKRAEVATRSWIVCNLVEIVRIGVHPDSRDLSNANRALEILAKLGGHLIDRKMVDSRQIDLGSLDSAQLHALLAGYLDKVSPGERARIEAITVPD